MKKISTFIGAAALLASGSASAIVKGGVDFGVIGLTSHLETTTLAETFVNDVGQTLTGYGSVDRVNGNLNYAGSQRLYFVFNYDVAAFDDTVNPNQAGFNNGTTSVFLGNDLGNLLNQSSAANIAAISALTPWVTLKGHVDGSGYELSANGQLTGASLSFLGAGLLDVDLAGPGIQEVKEYLDQNNVDDTVGGFADIILGTEGNNQVTNPFDDVDGCGTDAGVGKFCVQGSASLRGTISVPEPSTIALLGLGLLSFGTSALRKKKSV